MKSFVYAEISVVGSSSSFSPDLLRGQLKREWIVSLRIFSVRSRK